MIALKASPSRPLLLQAAGLARSTFFCRQAALKNPDRHAELRAQIHEAFTEAKGRYGQRPIHAVLRGQGWQVARKTVLKLMREENLVCKVRTRSKYFSYKGQVGKIAENLLIRESHTDAPNVAFTNKSPTEAIGTLAAGEAPMMHSEQGFQHQHASWQKLLRIANMAQSMSRKGNCLDKSVMENFFGHLKAEMFHRQEFTDTNGFKTELDDDIHWHNHDRISLTRQCLSPMEYQAQALAA